MNPRPDRRTLLRAGGAAACASLLAGCDRLPKTAVGTRALQAGEDASRFVQRLLLSPDSLAPEYAKADLSPAFRANGTSDPPDKAYKALARRNFSTYRLEIGGLVERPERIGLADIRKLPARTQITRHDCVEGWSCIGEWTGVPLSTLLQRVGLRPEARFVVFHCFDTMEGGESDDGEGSDANPEMSKGGGSTEGTSQESEDDEDGTAPPVRYYESIDLVDASHPQTILAYGMNGGPLPVAHGAPLRLRVERQLGYKMAKYIRRIEVVADYATLGDGRGGYWEDRGYDWYAGI